jgi:membrane protein YqaA with SNARE-associated domain
MWGFAEATLFFLVPDIWLTALAVRRGLKPALMACLAALGGALLGGLAMYGWAASDAEAARGLLERVPAIDRAMIAEVAARLRDDGLAAVFLGPLFGIPYKIFAVEAAAAGIGLAAFLAVSIPARLLRFLLLSIITWAISAALARRAGLRFRTGLLAACWSVFYVAYFAVMGF